MNLKEVMVRAKEIADEKGFTAATPGEDIALIHSEASEALEAYRDGHRLTTVWYEDKQGNTYETMYGMVPPKNVGDPLVTDSKNPRKPCGVPSEMADIIIRVAHFCEKHGIDLPQAVAEKMVFNASRPPMHGGKRL